MTAMLRDWLECWSGESISYHYHLIAELENYIVSCELSLTFSK